MSIRGPFDLALKLKSRKMQLTNANGDLTIEVDAAIYNSFTVRGGPEEIAVDAYEFVVSSSQLDSYGVPARGDTLSDITGNLELGDNGIKEVRPLQGLKGEIVGYRLRVS